MTQLNLALPAIVEALDAFEHANGALSQDETLMSEVMLSWPAMAGISHVDNIINLKGAPGSLPYKVRLLYMHHWGIKNVPLPDELQRIYPELQKWLFRGRKIAGIVIDRKVIDPMMAEVHPASEEEFA